jgi:VIT1/CCC1 family predicted Fe2+/Mn2+ transporter
MRSSEEGDLTDVSVHRESYQATCRACDSLIKYSPNETADIIRQHFKQYSVPTASSTAIAEHLSASPIALKDFLLKHHFSVAAPPDNRPYISALTLGLAYILGGIIPLIPYFFITEVSKALWVSVGLMAGVLLVFGWVKTGVVRGWRGRENVLAGVKGALQMLVVGAVAAGAAVGLVRGLNQAGNLR